jgi:hypothetical protein
VFYEKGKSREIIFMALSSVRRRQIHFNNFCCPKSTGVKSTPIWPKSDKEKKQKK